MVFNGYLLLVARILECLCIYKPFYFDLCLLILHVFVFLTDLSVGRIWLLTCAIILNAYQRLDMHRSFD